MKWPSGVHSTCPTGASGPPECLASVSVSLPFLTGRVRQSLLPHGQPQGWDEIMGRHSEECRWAARPPPRSPEYVADAADCWGGNWPILSQSERGRSLIPPSLHLRLVPWSPQQAVLPRTQRAPNWVALLQPSVLL